MTDQPTTHERGAILLIASVTMIMLLLFAAIVVDVGQVMLERRHDQSVADVAVIAGAMSRWDESELANTVLVTINDNLDDPMILADLDTCPSETLPPNWATYPNYNCLAHNQSYTEIRLRLPEREIRTAFGLLAGVGSLSHSAFAQANDRAKGDVLPFAISATAGTYECLKAGAGNVPDDDCSGADSGNFGPVIFGLWGNELMGTTKDCTGKDQFMTNLAQGIDHDLSIYGSPPHVLPTAEVVDTDSCGTTAAPNAMDTYTGNTPQNLYDGILSGDTFPDGGGARFRRFDGMSWFQTTTIADADADDNPIWEFIDPTLDASDDVPRSCWKDQFIGDGGGLNPDNDLLMTSMPSDVADHLLNFDVPDRMIKLVQRCLEHYEGRDWDDEGALSPVDPTTCHMSGCTDPVFSLDSAKEGEDIWDIQASSRFGYVPQLTAGTVLSGKTTVRIDSFRAVFLQRVYGGNCNPGGCTFIYDPGVDSSYNGSASKANALTAFVLPPSSLPGRLGDPDAPNSFGVTRFVRLSR
jgi:hypothetical protein